MTGPAHVPAGRPGVGLTSEHARRIGHGGAGRTVVLDGLDVPVVAGMTLRYTLLPVLDQELAYRSTYVAVDLLLDDGTWLLETEPGRELRDQHRMPATAAGQGEARILVPDHWNAVRVDLDQVAARLPGRRVRAAAVVTAPPDGGDTEVWLDAVTVGPRPERAVTGRTDLVDTRRGTHSSGAYSRGNNVPAAAVPNGFTMWVPLTDASTERWLYSWAAHNGPDNRPRLQGVGISHEPSPWMGDRDQLAFHLVPAQPGEEGTPDAGLAARALGFSHDAETARPHRYGVDLDGGSRIDVAASDHGGVLRFTFPPGATTGHLIVDAVSDAGADGPPVAVTVHDDGTLTGWSDHGSALSVGRSRMYVVGQVSRPVLRTGRARGREHATYATVALDPAAGPGGQADRTVEVRVATSYISEDLAWRALDREVSGSFDDVAERARTQWEERLGVLDVAGATEEQQVTLYSNLYRLNLYPSSYTEFGTDGELVHASPVLDGAPVAARRDVRQPRVLGHLPHLLARVRAALPGRRRAARRRVRAAVPRGRLGRAVVVAGLRGPDDGHVVRRRLRRPVPARRAPARPARHLLGRPAQRDRAAHPVRRGPQGPGLRAHPRLGAARRRRVGVLEPRGVHQRRGPGAHGGGARGRAGHP